MNDCGPNLLTMAISTLPRSGSMTMEYTNTNSNKKPIPAPQRPKNAERKDVGLEVLFMLQFKGLNFLQVTPEVCKIGVFSLRPTIEKRNLRYPAD